MTSAGERRDGIVTYVDGSETGTVAGSHVGVEGLDGIRPGHLTVLLVHVVGARAGIISDPDTEVLDLGGVLLVNLQKRKTSVSLSFIQKGKK